MPPFSKTSSVSICSKVTKTGAETYLLDTLHFPMSGYVSQGGRMYGSRTTTGYFSLTAPNPSPPVLIYSISAPILTISPCIPANPPRLLGSLIIVWLQLIHMQSNNPFCWKYYKTNIYLPSIEKEKIVHHRKQSESPTHHTLWSTSYRLFFLYPSYICFLSLC